MGTIITAKVKKAIDILQWVLIIAMVVVCLFMYFSGKRGDLVTEDEYSKEQTYIKIYESQTIESLKKRNRELYDSIKTLTNVETAVRIKYVYCHSTDTVRVENVSLGKDSVYRYAFDNDTVKQTVEVKARELQWLRSNFEVHDEFTIVNREKDGVNQTIIDHSPNAEITSVETFHRKGDGSKWYERFTVSPQVGVGYGMINNKVDVFLGVGVGYDF